MKKLISLFLFIDCFLKAQSPNFDWVSVFSGNNGEIATCITLDSLNNIYVSGRFQGIVDFDPSPATYTLNSSGGFDVFIAKLNPNGGLIWVKQIGGTGNEGGQSITVDINGYIISTGYFQSLSDFDPSPSSFSMTPIGYSDCYILKLDMYGNFIYAKQLGGNNSVFGNEIKSDFLGNILLTGFYDGPSDFDPGISTYTLTTFGGRDIFTLKLDNLGNFIWAVGLGSSSNEESLCIDIDNSGNIYTSGYYDNTLDFDPGAGVYYSTPLGTIDFYVLKLDPNGNFVFLKSIGGSYYDTTFDICIDNSSNIFLTGYFESTVDFDPGIGTYNLNCPNYADIFVLKLDVNGNFIFAKQMAGTSLSLGHSICVDPSGAPYVTGWFEGTTDFDPGPGTYTLSPKGSTDIITFKLDQNGNYVWAQQFSGGYSTSGNYGNGITVNNAGDVYTCGQFQDTIDFDPGMNTYNIVALGNTDAYVHKLCQSCPLSIAKEFNDLNLFIYPNPSSNYIYLNLTNEYIGGQIFMAEVNGKIIYGNKIKENIEKITFDLSAGLYLIKLISKEGISKTKKIVIEN